MFCRKEQDDCYEIRLQGCLDEHWASWFGEMTLTTLPSGETLLSGRLPDQAALQGILRKIQELGLPLVSVQRCKR
jgi:hypothetical protein